MQGPSVEELNSMTLQVGLVGSDGIVMASDTLVQEWQWHQHNPTNDRYTESKFQIGNGFVCCWSGDAVAERASLNIRRQTWASIKDDVTEGLISAGNEAWKQTFGDSQRDTVGPNRTVIVACPDNTLWTLQISEFSIARRRYDKAIGGGEGNSARHFLMNYLPKVSPPVTQLLIIAAHTILMGAKENQSGIGGLEMIVIPNGCPPIHLLHEQHEQLRNLSDSLYGIIWSHLSEPFDYAASV